MHKGKSVKVYPSEYVISPYSDIARALAGQFFESGSSTLQLLFGRVANTCRINHEQLWGLSPISPLANSNLSQTAFIHNWIN